MTVLVPTPCRRCGAPMSEADPASIYGSTKMVCDFCGSEEELPAETSARVRALRQRLRQIAWAAKAVEAPALSAAHALETWKSMLVPGALAIIGISVLGAVVQATSRTQLDAAAILQVAIAPVVVIAIVCGVQLGSFLALRAYRAELAPTLLAFAPRETNGAARCRQCGGDLPSVARKAFVTCGYCGAQNLVTLELAERNAADLDRELEVHRARAAGMTSQVAAAHAKLKRRMGYAAMAGMAVAGSTGLLAVIIFQLIL